MASSTSRSSMSYNRELDVDEKTLMSLLDAFGSKFPLKDIASAYIEAGKNAELTGEILYRMHDNSIIGDVYTDHEEISEITSESSNSSGSFEPSFKNGDAISGGSKMKSNPVSMGSVSGFNYATASALSKGVRPVKSGMRWVVKHSARNSSPDPDASQHKEYEDFLFKMLQHGFRVDRAVIRQVLGECGYDLKKSLEMLIDLAAENHHSKYKLNKVPEGKQTVGAERTSSIESLKDDDDNEEQDDDYKILRQAVKEYRSTMNVYYKAGAEAFAKGDRARSITLLEKGEFFYKKAREADEESAKRIFSSSLDEEEIIPLNLENCTPKDAARILKSHLRNFSGIASVKYLRITNGVKGEDASKRASRIRMVIKLLESESINWNEDEDEDSETILVSLVEIDPQRLTFSLV